MESILHKHILTEWVNGGFESRWLRYINRQTKTSYISDCNYTYNPRKSIGNKLTYRIIQRQSQKFSIKDGDIVERANHLSNPDGKLTITLIEDIESLVCKKTFSDIFRTDLTKILDKDSYKLKKIEQERGASEKYNFAFTEEMLTYERDIDLEKPTNQPLYIYLTNFFKRDRLYYLYDYETERGTNMSFIEKEITRMHVNHFGEYKKILSNEENHNQTIGFWLFSDCLVYTSQSGKDTW